MLQIRVEVGDKAVSCLYIFVRGSLSEAETPLRLRSGYRLSVQDFRD